MPELDRIVADIAAEITRDAARIERDADAKDRSAKPGPFGMAVVGVDGTVHRAGTHDERFPIQSIAKVFALELALCRHDRKVFERVGREPSGDPFNSIVDLERNDGVPRNPFVNAGALAIVDMLVDRDTGEGQDNPVVRLVGRHGKLDRVPLDADVLESEHSAGDLNRAMLSFMRHHDNLTADPDIVMRAYVEQCAISLNCAELATAGCFLAHTRLSGDEGERRRAKRTREVLALMMTCGHYDASGDFALRVGVPAKSGVGGGILAIVPQVASVAVWSRNLDQHGNSMLGVRALEMLADRTGWSVFGPPLEE